MSTNYYLNVKCRETGVEERVHIGKSTMTNCYNDELGLPDRERQVDDGVVFGYNVFIWAVDPLEFTRVLMFDHSKIECVSGDSYTQHMGDFLGFLWNCKYIYRVGQDFS